MTCLPSAMNSPRLCLGKNLGMALRDSGDDDDSNNESYGVVAIYSFDKHLWSTCCVPGILLTSGHIRKENCIRLTF